jgi:hypothetical protein
MTTPALAGPRREPRIHLLSGGGEVWSGGERIRKDGRLASRSIVSPSPRNPPRYPLAPRSLERAAVGLAGGSWCSLPDLAHSTGRRTSEFPLTRYV